VQQIEHTSIAFSALYFAFVLVSALAFNVAGGFSRVAGAYWCWFSMLVVIVGVTWKMMINEPGDSNLLVPTLSMSCYLVSAVMFLVVAVVLRRFDLRSYEFGAGGRSQTLNYTVAGLGCILVSVFNQIAVQIFGMPPGGLLSALHQLDQFLPLGIILATIGAVHDSNGRRTMNFINGFGMLIFFAQGLSGFSKQGMITPMVCWLVGITYMQFRLRRVHILAIAFGTFISFYALSPLSQARDLLDDNMGFSDRVELGIDSLIHIQRIRQHVEDSNDSPPSHSYFATQQNALITRLTMIGVDDALIHYAETAQPLGFGPVKDDFLNFIPHALLPNKGDVITGNYYGHEIGGMLAYEDFETGISFSPVAETFRLQGFLGLCLTLPAIWLMLFSVNEFICGDLRTSPWTLLPMLLYAHIAPEGLLSGQIYMIGFGNGAFLLGILVCTRLAPTLGRLFYGSAIESTREVAPQALFAQGSHPATAAP
jgi:hypothetical protein